MKLPHVLAIVSKKDEVVLDIELSPQLEAFRGHFPNNPVLPGVVQIDWAVRFTALHLGITEPAARDFQVKFRNIIRPDIPISLTLKVDHSKGRLSFMYQSGADIMSSGQLKLGASA
jgi:3-hydroxymyristoyl/3-hydroxydecanoyl-(acyl carrier protein) dehydratase